MKRKSLTYTFVLILVMTFALISLSACGNKSEAPDNYNVRIMLRPCEGIEISGENIADIEAGRGHSFSVSIEEGYVYLGSTGGAVFDEERGKLRLTDVIAPTTVDMIVAKEEDVIRLDIRSTHPRCEVSASQTLLPSPGRVRLTAAESGSLEFVGWSENGFIEDGGELISPLPDYSLELNESKTVYANFSGFSEYTITYHLMGGKTADGSEELSVAKPFSDIFSMQQTLESNGSFTKDGYSAVGYSTDPCELSDYESANDIPGFSNMGGICSVEGETLDLYVVWAKETAAKEFTYEKKKISYISDSAYSWGKLNQRKKSEDGIEITDYTGSDGLVVIPESIEGLPVLAVAQNAFSGDNIRRVVIPRTVKNIADNAFSGCEKLKEVVIFDSVVTVSNESFPSALSTVVLNAQRLPVYSGAIEGSFAIKYERLRTVEGKKIIIVSGSSSLNGINSPIIEELMPGYSVVNFGTNVANPATFFLDVISKYVSEGDITVHAPEFSSSSSMGGNEFHAKVFRGFEQCYDIFRDVDISDYTDFWGAFSRFQVGDPKDSSLVPAIQQTGKEYQLDTEMNSYGDRSTTRKQVRGSFGGATEVFKYGKLGADNLNWVNKKFIKNGAVLAMSFGTFDKSRLSPRSATQSEYDKFTQSCADKLDYPVISNVGTYIMEHKYFYDSEWHLNDEGASIRSKNLAADIMAYLQDPDKY